MSATAERARSTARMQFPSLLVGLVIMLGGTVYPLLMANSKGQADHALASLLFWAMSAGFVRGFGFVPESRALRWLFSGWACLAALLLAGAIRLTC